MDNINNGRRGDRPFAKYHAQRDGFSAGRVGRPLVNGWNESPYFVVVRLILTDLEVCKQSIGYVLINSLYREKVSDP